jgi:4-hydroxybenzoate polyprenyltransferase
MKRFFLPSNLHLTLSTGIVIPMGGLYGLRPDFSGLA